MTRTPHGWEPDQDLSALEAPELRERFSTELEGRLREAHPVRHGQVVLPFRRTFTVAQTGVRSAGAAR